MKLIGKKDAGWASAFSNARSMPLQLLLHFDDETNSQQVCIGNFPEKSNNSTMDPPVFSESAPATVLLRNAAEKSDASAPVFGSWHARIQVVGCLP